MSLIITWITTALALWVASALLDKLQIKGGLGSYAWVAAIFGVLHFLVGWLIFGVIGVVSLGLGFVFSFISKLLTTAVVLKLADAMSSRFRVDGFATALWAALIMSGVTEGARWLLATVGH